MIQCHLFLPSARLRLKIHDRRSTSCSTVFFPNIKITGKDVGALLFSLQDKTRRDETRRDETRRDEARQEDKTIFIFPSSKWVTYLHLEI